MPTISRIIPGKTNPARVSVYVDGRFALACSANLIAKFGLRVGAEVTPEGIEQLRQGQVRQECIDTALEYLGRRLHSRQELARKLGRAKYDLATIDAALAELQRLGYVDDQRYAKTRALSAAQYKQHGRRRAYTELLKAGVSSADAQRALDEVYEPGDNLILARRLAEKHAARLRRLDPVVARRRLAAMLQRRGFDYEVVREVIDGVLGGSEG